MEMSCQTNQHRSKQSPGLHVFLNCFLVGSSLLLSCRGRGIKSPGMGKGLLLPLGVLSHKDGGSSKQQCCSFIWRVDWLPLQSVEKDDT